MGCISFLAGMIQGGNASNLNYYAAQDLKDSSVEGSCRGWLPNQGALESWSMLYKLAKIQNTVALLDSQAMGESIDILRTPDICSCENGKSAVIILKLFPKDAKVSIDHIKVLGEGFTISEKLQGDLPLLLNIRFTPKNQIWGLASGHLILDGRLDDHPATPLDIIFPVTVTGPFIPSRSIVYLGIGCPGQPVVTSLVLRPKSALQEPSLHILNIQTPEGITATCSLDTQAINNYKLNISWIPGITLGAMKGDIHLIIDKPEKGDLRIPVCGIVRS
jgi:hypothetical protein